MSHIIGRPNDDLLDVMLGHGADPEQAFIDGSDQGLEEGDGQEEAIRAAAAGRGGVPIRCKSGREQGPHGEFTRRL